jgi:pyruvate dehydrogenase E2 component (dihydrolipoamide acetyltransferase)/2-oxoglutarate dehydrogenase E2 component (dihydrolipoamide succinyltransferase)
MPHDVTMPQLGMAQDAGKIVSWLKRPGDAVSRGDALFEVETDKAVMEVEALADGVLTSVAFAAGEDVPVGHVIARISSGAEAEAGDEGAAVPAAGVAVSALTDDAASPALPEGHRVSMPQLGMAQDSGLLVGWLKAPGDAVGAEDVLFEVETDKSTMEVEAGRAGWLAATLAEAGEEVPVGEAVAIISEAAPAAPVTRARGKETSATPATSATSATPPAPVASASATPVASAAAGKLVSGPPVARGGRILASPKARRLALEQGLDLARLVEAGHPQPFHVADLEVLRALPAAPVRGGGADGSVGVARRLTARCARDGLVAFAAWAAQAHGLDDVDAILAGLAGASLGADDLVHVAVHRYGRRVFAVPPGRALGAVYEVVEGSDDLPALVLRDLRGTRLASVALGAEEIPVVTITDALADAITDGAADLDGSGVGSVGLSITLECAAWQLEPEAALRLLIEFAGRMEEPLRHLL